MAGDRAAYNNNMTKGHNAAWDQDWQTAIKAYTAAIQEIPEDPDAHVHLGLSLLKAGRLDDSLKVYTRAYTLAPDDPVPLEKSADVLERMGRLKEAAQQYINVSEIYLSMRDLDKAIGNWERATQLTPGLVSIHAKLAQAYERIGDKKQAVREYLTLAFNFQRLGETEKAIKAVERALRLERRNAQALNILRALKSGGEVVLPEEITRTKPDPRGTDEIDIFSEDFDDSRSSVGDADPLGPMGEAMSMALGALAGHVVESGNLDASGGDAMQGMEFQRQEMKDEAIAAYLRAEPGLRHPALKMNLGALLVQVERPEEAVKHLGEATMDPNLASGALHAMGKANFDMKKYRQASRYLIQSLQAVDTSLAVDSDEAAELADVYARLLTALDGRTEDALHAINKRFLEMLSGNQWKQRIADTRRHLEEVMRDEGEQGIVDFLGSGGSDELATIVSRIDTYIRQGTLTLAMDEAHMAVESSPLYLPVHVRMAEIMMREGRVRQAINKYNMVARSYMVREENDRAASILSEVLEMAPLDVSVRISLIELLEGEERIEESLDQYIELANTYNQLGNFDLARDAYHAAERLARRIDAPAAQTVRIKHRLADMDQMRLDTRRALRTYEEIVELVPGDERAHRQLVDLNYNQGNQVEAIRRLDKLLSLYATRKEVQKMLKILEDMVRSYPNDTGLRSRLAMIYKQMGRKEDAIEQLDALGELQLEAGQHSDARNTIKQIIGLKPDGIEEYRRLLSQLGG